MQVASIRHGVAEHGLHVSQQHWWLTVTATFCQRFLPTEVFRTLPGSYLFGPLDSSFMKDNGNAYT